MFWARNLFYVRIQYDKGEILKGGNTMYTFDVYLNLFE